ncbi:protein kinase domain-containing protein [Nannocystis pusilla]|uniref:protein kinase domain-containing protein n=1 Tax=Nannocystis pusilla TaxID=889268 RepID=UPI003B82F0D0
MGIVYAAHDAALAREVAIKVLSRRHFDNRQIRARMVREAQALARLSHPNVVQVYQVGEHDEGIYVAMEYVHGHTLRSWLRAERRPWQQVLRTMLGAGRGLAAAHAAGLVHRDFKPDNVLVGEDTRARGRLRSGPRRRFGAGCEPGGPSAASGRRDVAVARVDAGAAGRRTAGGAAGRSAHAHRDDRRDADVHVARAALRRRHRAGVGPIQLRRHALRGAVRDSPVSRRELGGAAAEGSSWVRAAAAARLAGAEADLPHPRPQPRAGAGAALAEPRAHVGRARARPTEDDAAGGRHPGGGGRGGRGQLRVRAVAARSVDAV